MDEATSSIPHKFIGVAVIWNDRGQILIDRRRPQSLLGGLWEFPGGKIEPDETVEECITREIREELGIEVSVGCHLMSIDHVYTHLHVTLKVHVCHHLTGTPMPIDCDEVRWVTVQELDAYPFLPANQQIITALQQMPHVG